MGKITASSGSKMPMAHRRAIICQVEINFNSSWYKSLTKVTALFVSVTLGGNSSTLFCLKKNKIGKSRNSLLS